MPGASHVMKAGMRAGTVRVFGVAFNGCPAAMIAEFRQCVAAGLNADPTTFGPFDDLTPPNRPDTLFILQQDCSEAVIDKMLRAVAAQLGLAIYIEPAILWAELTVDLENFLF